MARDTPTTELPPELLLHTFSFLDGVDLGRCARACSSWRALADDPHHWKVLCMRSDIPEKPTAETAQPPEWAGSWKGMWSWWHRCSATKFDAANTQKAGCGTFTWPQQGCRFVGEWSSNREHGRGYKVWPDGASFWGTFLDGKFNGCGVHTWASGSKYSGTWLHHKRNGRGVNVWPSETYEGEWLDDHKSGLGTYVWSDGRKYVGQWLLDRRSGTGTFIWPQLKCTYEGQWLMDKRHGHGVFRWDNGDVFEGQWKMGKRCGDGVFVRASDGRQFLQHWEETTQFDMKDRGDLSREAEPKSPAPVRAMDVDEEGAAQASPLYRKRKLDESPSFD
jgi:hypothetical protein